MRKKLQPDHDFWGLLIPICVILLFASMFTLFGVEAAFYSLTVVFATMGVYNIYVIFRTGNLSFIIVALYLLVTALFCAMVPTAIADDANDTSKLVLIPLLFLGGMTWAQFLLKNFKWRGREVFELAAEDIDTTFGGYTNRPLPAGENTVSFHKVNAFAAFAQRKMIAMVVKEPCRILFFPIKEGKGFKPMFLLRQNMDQMTYIAFDRDGVATVQISEEDYLDFRQDYSFDLLCAALGELFIAMIEQYANGEEKAIIERMNQVGYGYFS